MRRPEMQRVANGNRRFIRIHAGDRRSNRMTVVSVIKTRKYAPNFVDQKPRRSQFNGSRCDLDDVDVSKSKACLGPVGRANFLNQQDGLPVERLRRG